MSRFPHTALDNFCKQREIWGALPKDSLYTSGLASRDKTVYRIGERFVTSCFVLQRGDLYTVYAKPSYGDYKGAFISAINVDVVGRDIDHFLAKAAAKKDMLLDKELREASHPAASPDGRIFVALGALPYSLNRSAGAGSDLGTLISKASGESGTDAAETISQTALSDVSALQLATGFRVPHEMVNWSSVKKFSTDTAKPSELTAFAEYLAARG